MTANDWDDLAARLITHLDEQTTDSADSVLAVAVDDYLDEERWGQEIEAIFHNSPVVCAVSAQIKAPGTYRAVDITGIPVLTVRQSDGGVKAFINACRHRGAQLVEPGCGEARRFACPYHAWTYDGEGTLVGIAGRNKFGDIDPEQRGLTELPCEERSGLVFTVLRPGATLDLDAWLGGYDDVLAHLDLANMEFVDERHLVGPNWKVAFDGYVDGYHLDILHRDSIGKDIVGNVMTCDAWGPHQRVAFARPSLLELREAPRAQWEPQKFMGLVHTVFPHVSIAGNGSSGLMISQLFPGPTPDRSTTIQTHLLAADATADQREATSERADLLEYVVREEDYKTGLGIQGALASGANRDFVFGRNEPGNQRFHQWVDKLIGKDH